MSTSERGKSYGESNKESKEGQGPTLGVRFIEVSSLQGCLLRENQPYYYCIVHLPDSIRSTNKLVIVFVDQSLHFTV